MFVVERTCYELGHTLQKVYYLFVGKNENVPGRLLSINNVHCFFDVPPMKHSMDSKDFLIIFYNIWFVYLRGFNKGSNTIKHIASVSLRYRIMLSMVIV